MLDRSQGLGAGLRGRRRAGRPVVRLRGPTRGAGRVELRLPLRPSGKPTGRCELRTREARLEQIPGTWELQTVLVWAARSIWSVAFSADGRYLAAACRRPGGGNIPNGGGARCWARGAAENVATLPDDTYALAFVPSGCSLAVTRQQAVLFFSDPLRPPTVEYRLTSDWSAAVAFVPGAELAVVGTNSFLDFMNPIRKEKPTRLKTGIRTVLALAVSSDGKTILAGGKPGAVEVYDTASRTRTTTYDFEIGSVYSLAFAPDGLTFTAGGDKGLVVCDASA